MKTTLGQKILFGFIGCAIILAVVAVFSFRNSEKFVATNQWVNHTQEVLNEYSNLLGANVDAETSIRGFVISGNENFLNQYKTASDAIADHLEKIKKLTLDNPVQQKNIDELRPELEKHAAYFENLIAVRRKDFEKAKQIVSSGEGNLVQENIRRLITVGTQIETNLLAERKTASDQDLRSFNLIFIVLMIIIAFVLVVVYYIIRVNLRALKKAELETANKNWLLAGSFELNEKTRGEQKPTELAQSVIEQLCTYLNVQAGAVYLFENGQLHLSGTYAFQYRQHSSGVIDIGEGLVGQAAKEKR